MVPMSLTPFEKGLDLVERDGHASFELVAERLAGPAQDDPVTVEQHVAAVVQRARVAGAALDELEALPCGHPADPVLTHLVGHRRKAWYLMLEVMLEQLHLFSACPRRFVVV